MPAIPPWERIGVVEGGGEVVVTVTAASAKLVVGDGDELVVAGVAAVNAPEGWMTLAERRAWSHCILTSEGLACWKQVGKKGQLGW